MVANRAETAIRTVKVKKARLMETLRSNLEIHRKEYKEARAGFEEARRHAYSELSKASQHASDADSEKARQDAAQSWNNVMRLDDPKDHSESYEQAIALMEWETRDEIELSINDFESYVRDRWDWQHHFKMSHANYAG